MGFVSSKTARSFALGAFTSVRSYDNKIGAWTLLSEALLSVLEL